MNKSTPIKGDAATSKKADQYNDPNHNYLHYWDGREYEHAAEEIAIRRLLKGRHFKQAVDIGGGYGRLCVLLENYADKVTLAEPSQQQLDIAKDYLKDHPEIDKLLIDSAEKLDLPDASMDLVTMIRVMHHLPDPNPTFAEIARVMSPAGYFVLEIANYAHGRNRLKYLLKGEKLPEEPVDIRSEQNRREEEIAFVNHHPTTVRKQLAVHGLSVERTLSVSNLRSPGLKKVVPKGAMLAVERVLQPTLASSYFGPSVFFLVRKNV